MQKKLDKIKVSDSIRYNQMVEFLNSFMVPCLKDVVTKKSIYNQFVSDLVTKIDNNIYQENTTVHVFILTFIHNI